ncbi:peptidase M23 [Xenophilus sp. AP218F]|nr:peptidase M23 [Xenophilus sp. AP218F]
MVQPAAPVESAAGGSFKPIPAPTAGKPAPVESGAVATPYQAGGDLNAQPVSAAPVTAGEKTHVVKPGENLFRISLNNGLKYKDVAAWNNLPDNNIKVGQVLRLTPPGSDSAAAPVAAPPASTAAASPAPAASAAQQAPANAGAAVKAYPKALKLPYDNNAAKTLAAQSEGRAEEKIVAQAPSSSSAPQQAGSPKKEASAATAIPKTESSAPAAKGGEDAVPWIWPTEGKLIKGYSDSSKGVDISGRMGQAIMAAGDGKVVYSGTGLRGYGKLIIIKHNKTFLSAYAHNSQLLVKEGQSVKKGQKIAEMGNSDADQVKLHFEIRRFGKPVDPMQYLEHKS